MPNWCYNTLVAEGPSDPVMEFVNGVRSNEQPFDFERIIPMPPVLREINCGSYISDDDGTRVRLWRTNKDGKNIPVSEQEKESLVAEYGYDNWYDWANANWGTKWNAWDVKIDVVPNSVERTTTVYIEFVTAWAPPEPIFMRLEEQYPNVTFSFVAVDEFDR